jgi:LysR family nitrogen assimilation transcriptional regulator
MNSEDLTMFLGVAASGNFSRAAVEIGLSQSALSRRVSALETELNTRLFYRSGRGVVPTEAGLRLIKYATQVVNILQEARSDLSSSINQGPSSIVLAAQPTIAKILFGSVGKALKLQYPGIKMRFKEGLAGHIQEWIANGEIDAAIMYLPENHVSLGVDVILRERLSFVAPLEFGAIGTSFRVERLCDIPMVLPAHPHGLRVLAESLAARFSKPLNLKLRLHTSTARLGSRRGTQRHTSSHAISGTRSHSRSCHYLRPQPSTDCESMASSADGSRANGTAGRKRRVA